MTDEAPKRQTTRERLQELYRRLDATPKSPSAEEAFRKLCEMLDQVEDEFSGIPKSASIPTPSMRDGRMYRPLEDHVARLANGGILAMTRGHRIEIATDGSLRIINKVTGFVEFEK